MGWGVVPWGTGVQTSSTPTPDPSPQGGGEEFAAPSSLNLAPMKGSGGTGARRGNSYYCCIATRAIRGARSTPGEIDVACRAADRPRNRFDDLDGGGAHRRGRAAQRCRHQG